MSPRLLLLLFIAFAQAAVAADDPTRRQFDPDPARPALALHGRFTDEPASRRRGPLGPAAAPRSCARVQERRPGAGPLGRGHPDAGSGPGGRTARLRPPAAGPIRAARRARRARLCPGRLARPAENLA